MSLRPGTRLGPYEIQSALGAGGMGEVYRARDTKLGRSVAIKVLPEALARDPDRIARFEREAKVLASLNHPHIAAIYGVVEGPAAFDSAQAGEAGPHESTAVGAGSSRPVHALVMELVEGETVAERLKKGALPLDDALRVAAQVADALEAAHEKGVIHRDLKPGNIMLDRRGGPSGPPDVKVLDFGLAKAMESAGSGQQAAGSADLSVSPTLSMMATQAGVILGTAAYMSPEQAKGFPADQRSDVFSFGCVLYEMLTGRQVFQGDAAAEVLASVLIREPDLTTLPPNLNPRLPDLVKRCLDKNPKRRWQAMGDVRAEVESIAANPLSVPAATAVAARREPLWRRLALYSAPALLAGLATAGGGVWFAMRPAPPRVSRLLITSTSTAALSINGFDRDLAITPDASRVIYVGTNGSQLFVRALDALEPTAIFTGGPRAPFVSPDGQWIGFVDNTNTLKKVAVTGGPPVTLANLDGTSRGAVWAPDDTIIFATNNVSTGLQRVAASGGPMEVLTRPDQVHGETDHLWPEVLPGGRAVLFTIAAQTGGLDASQVAVLDLQTGTRRILIRGGSHAHYVPGGHLVYAAAGTLRAVPFDVARLEVRGAPVPVVPEVSATANGGVDAVVASNGTLAYISGGGVPLLQRTLVWVGRQGQETPIPAPPRAYTYPRIAPDGTRVVVWADDQESDLWLWDLARLTLTRMTFAPALDLHPAWTPDGRRLIFSSEREGARNIFWQAADGTGAVERLTKGGALQNAVAVSPDGTRLIFTEATPKTGDDVMQVELTGTHRVTPLVQSPFAERNGIISPDGRWLAYEANDSGQLEIYVRPYPDVNTGHWQVSTGGGTRPLWSPNGQELFFVSPPAGALMRVGVERAASWSATTPTMIMKEGYVTTPAGNPGRNYDISPDGQRFLMIKQGAVPGQAAAPTSIIVVQNWGEELKRLVPTR